MERTVRAVLRADVGSFESDMRRAATATESVGKAAQTSAQQTQRSTQEQSSSARSFSQNLVASARSNEQAWSTVGKTMAGVGAAITGIGAAALNTGIQYNTLQQTTSAALTTILGDAQAVSAQMAEFDDFATTSPFARQVFLEAQQQMLGFGIEAQKVVPYLDAIQNAVAAVGGSNQDVAELSTIMAQISATSKITAQDLNMFGQRGLDAASIIGEQMGMTGAQIREQITAGTLDAGAALDALADGMQGRFAGAADGLKDTFDGAMDRVRAVWRDVGAMLAEPVVSADGGGILVDLANSVADLGRAFLGLPGPVQTAISGLAGLVGVTSLVGGGFMVLFPRVVNLVDQLNRLGAVGAWAGNGLRAVGRNVGRITITAAVISGLVAAARGLEHLAGGGRLAAPAIDDMTDALRRMQDVGDLDDIFGGASQSLEGFNDALRAAYGTDFQSRMDRFGSALARMIPGDWADKVAASRESLDVMVESLYGMVDAGDAAGAWDIGEQVLTEINKMAEAGEISADLADEVIEALEGIRDAAQDQSYTEMWDRIIDRQQAAKESAAEMTAEWEALLDAGRNTARGLMDTGDMFADGWGIASLNKDLQELTANLEAFADNMESAHARMADMSIDSAPLFSFMDDMDSATQAQYLAMLEGLSDEEFRIHLEILADVTDAEEAFAEIDAMARDTPTDAVRVPIEMVQESDFGEVIPELNDPPTVTVPVDADTGPGSERFEALVATMGEAPPVDVTIGADPGPAMKVFNETTGAWETITTETLLGLDPSDSVRVFDRTTGEWHTTTTDTLLGMDPSEAWRKYGIATNEWANDQTDTNLGANDTSARGTVRDLGAWAALQNITVPITGRLAGIVTSGSASYAHGGYTGDGGKHEPAGVVHRGEWVTTKEHTADPFNRRVLESMHAGNLRAALAGYASGGYVTAPQPTRTFVTNYTAPAAATASTATPGPSAADIRSALDGVRVHLTGTENLADGVAGTLLTEMRAH